MLLILSKVIPAFLFPAGLAIVLCVLTAWLAFRKGARAAGIVAVCAALMLYAASSPLLSNRLAYSLERKYLPLRENPKASAIVLLGGGVMTQQRPRIYAETNSAGDRLLHAARLWRQGLAPIIVPTGGIITFMVDAAGTEADSYALLLTEVFGVPENAVIRMGRSRTTHEDALLTAHLFDSLGIAKDILLVTSASHMPRAVALFHKQGFTVHPAPTDYRSTLHAEFMLIRILPSGAALTETTVVLHEYLGMWAYRIFGRL